ncbi:MAG TPA: hypothetical protein ENI42_04865, partial [Thermoplasmatales archaeon]|nr:hypothetical protein [Thermoplasmatales archaeon]
SFDTQTGVTLEGWLKLNKNCTDLKSCIIGKNSAYFLSIHNSGQLYMNLHNGSRWVAATLSSTHTIDFLSKWHHYAGTYNKITGEVKLYIDGNLVKTQHPGSFDINVNNNQLCIGNLWSWYTYGCIKDVRVYNRALTDIEIKNNYNNNVTTTGLISWWKLNEGKGDVVHDNMGSNDAYVIGAEWFRYACHTYQNFGAYNVSLTVNDVYGANSSVSKTVSFQNNPPLADFVYTPENPTPRKPITFYDSSTDDHALGGWRNWDFDDGNSTQGEGCLYFDGKDDYVEVSHSQVLDLTDEITVDAWVWYAGGESVTVYAKDTGHDVGENYNDSGEIVRRAVKGDGPGNMLIYDFNWDENVHHGSGGIYLKLKIPEKPDPPVNVIKVEVWDLNTSSRVVNDVYRSSDFTTADTYYYGYQIKHHPTFFVTPKHSFRVYVYYYGNIDVYVHMLRFDRYHRPAVEKPGSWRLYRYSAVQFLVWHPDGTYTVKSYNPPGRKDYRSWVHVAGVYSKNNGLKLYFNGECVGSTGSNGKSIRVNTNPIWFSYHSNRHLMPGMIKDVRVYSRALTDAEIKQNFNGNIVTSGLIGWWKLNEGYGNVAQDCIGGNNGIIYDAKWVRYAEHTYKNPGVYHVTLTVEDVYGVKDTVSKTLVLTNFSHPETHIMSGPTSVIHYNNVTFEWTGVDDTTPPSNLLFSYKLEGYDTSWSTWSHTTSVSYYNLPNGGYTFKVKAKDEEGNIDPTPATREFTVHINKPPSITEFSPYDGEENITINPGNNIYPGLNVAVTDPDGDTLTIVFSTNASGTWQTIETSTGGNGTYTVSSSLMSNWLTWYYWSVNITDGENWVNQSFCFRTKPADWDINMDNQVNHVDASILSLCYMREDYQSIEPRSDINHDNKVDYRDASILSLHYGENYGGDS